MLLTTSKFAKILACFKEATGNGSGTWFQASDIRPLVAEIGNLLQKCKVLARGIKVGRPTRYLSCPEFSLVPPPRAVADTMIRLYFRYFESTHRILHAPSFWTEYDRYWDCPDNVPIGLRFKIFLVIAIGSILYKHGDKEVEFRNTVHQWVYAAQTWLSGPLEKDRLNITGLQAHCLTILARQIFCLGGDLVWTSIGSLLHRAIQIGLHHDPKYLPAMPVLQAEVRRRLWATILEMVVQSSLDSGMPPRISFDEFDTEAPSNNNDDEIDESATVLQPHPKGEHTTTSIQLILLSSLRTRHRILQLLNGLSSEYSYVDVLALSSDIIKACGASSIPADQNENSAVTPFHRNLLDYLVRRFLLPLHCPFSSRARTNPLFYYSRRASLDAAVAIISPEPDECFSRLMAIGGGMFREGIRYANIVVSLELIAQAEAQRFDLTLHRSSKYRALLKQTVKEMISLSVERIQHGETNIKSHTFLSMVIAQVESIEVGTSCELKIAQSARDSLQFCHDLLQAQAGFVSLPCYSEMDITNLDGGQGGYVLDFEMGTFL